MVKVSKIECNYTGFYRTEGIGTYLEKPNPHFYDLWITGSNYMKNISLFSSIIAIFISLSGCDSSESTTNGRWYTQAQVNQGEVLYKKNCSVCHKESAEGTSDWKKRLDNGALPPPPLNGNAHAWHHSMEVLLRTIDNGGVPLGGTMPAFKGQFSDNEKRSIIAYFQSFWRDKIYLTWESRNR